MPGPDRPQRRRQKYPAENAQRPGQGRHHRLGHIGWIGVNGFRGQTDTPEKMAPRIQRDLRYIPNGALWLDLKILLLTPKKMIIVLVHRNADC
jgi:lipopolysaccharide/colanic/teichoic acid biosynthesis glycosyltransferase